MNLLDLTALSAAAAISNPVADNPPGQSETEFSTVRDHQETAAADTVTAANFVLAETRAMPYYLRLGFTLCALAFNLLALITARGVFCRLPASRRLRVIALWERISGPGAQFTDFFRLMASFYAASKAESSFATPRSGRAS